MVTQNTNHIGMVMAWKTLLKISWKIPVFICLTAETLKNSGSFKATTYSVRFSGKSRSAKNLHLRYDRDNEHYNVITKLKGAVAKH